MSVDQAKAFIEKMKSDVAFRERLMAIKDLNARMAAANGEGFACTADEIKRVQGELSFVERRIGRVGGVREEAGDNIGI